MIKHETTFSADLGGSSNYSYELLFYKELFKALKIDVGKVSRSMALISGLVGNLIALRKHFIFIGLLFLNSPYLRQARQGIWLIFQNQGLIISGDALIVIMTFE